MDDIIGRMSNKTRDDPPDEERNSGGGGGGGGGYGGQGGGGGASDILGGIMGMIGGGGGGGGGGAAPAHPSMKHGGKGVGGVNMGSLIQSAFGNALGGGGGGGGGGGAAGLLQGLISGAVSGAGGGHGQGGGNAASGNLLGTIIGALSGGKNMGNQSDVTKGGNAMGDMFKTAVGHTLNSNPGSGGIGIIGDLVKKAIGWIVEKFFNLKGKYALKSRRGDAFNPAATVFNALALRDEQCAPQAAVVPAVTTMSTGAELQHVVVEDASPGRLAVPEPGRDGSDDDAPRAGRSSPASSRSHLTPSPGGSPAPYKRKVSPAPAENARYRPRGAGAQPPARKMSLMEVEALRDKKRLSHLKELERLLKEGLTGSSSTFSADDFIRTLVSTEVAAHLFGLFDVDGAGYYDQDEWIEFLKGRTKTAHQRELVEVLETAAYLVCGYNEVNLERFTSILQAKGVSTKFFRILQEKTNHHVTVAGAMDFIANLSNAR
ncbi:uncharacterized transmembrane protein DDB_G0289901-like [Pollicipes pollicipes]|uniref:uncharacterized transmembrane protein DDB_G0289901-like n=1 Tax=Pollicipes pollicipes TaxID=41117 RepID=UPI0018858221|nr:uncharacterized transmembrane protein DDB_G0289901-like [Pollicipes pollicipes]